jgi:hypothetical protein
MTDDDLDRLLTSRGEQWRQANADRPEVDWESITAPGRRRLWLGVGVVAVAAAVIIPVVMTAGHSGVDRHRQSGGPSAPASGLPRDPLDYQHGSPSEYFGLRHGNVRQFSEHVTGRTHEPRPVVALGGSAVNSVVYTASALPNCRTQLDVSLYLAQGGLSSGTGQPHPMATVAGQPVATPIAVSPRSGMLALVVTPAFEGHYSGSVLPCVGPEQIVFIKLRDGSLTNVVPVDSDGLQIDDLAWSPDGGQLAFRLSPNPDRTGPLRATTDSELGTHVMSVHETLRDLGAYPKVLPLNARDGATYGPVFWWHGELAALVDGALRPILSGGQLGNVVATGFTSKVDTVSRDDFGDHLLISAGGRSYRWDFGQLTRLPGHLLQPTW